MSKVVLSPRMNRGRSNMASALTRKARAALKSHIESVTVKSSEYLAGGEVRGREIEPLMAARQILTDAGIECSRIHTEWKSLGPCFFIQLPPQKEMV